MNIKSIMGVAMSLVLLAFIIPQVIFAETFLPCINPFSDSSKPESLWNCTGVPQTTPDTSSGSLSSNTTGSVQTQQTSGVTNVNSLFNLFQSFLGRALTLLISLAVVWFIWNVFYYIIAVDEVDKAVAKDKMVWGIVAIFVMISIWGLVAILQNTFRIGPSGPSGDVKQIMPNFELID